APREVRSRRLARTGRATGGGVHVGDDDDVSILKGARELAEETAQAMKMVRLKEADDPSGMVLTDGRQRRPDLRGMVCVVVENNDSTGFSDPFEPSSNPSEVLQRGGGAGEVYAHVPGGDRGRQRVRHGVAAGNA